MCYLMLEEGEKLGAAPPSSSKSRLAQAHRQTHNALLAAGACIRMADGMA